MNIRRVVWLAALAMSAAFAVPTWAQNPQASMVQKIARDWLAMADKEDAKGTWTMAGKKFQDSITEEQWSQSLVQVHMPIGKTLQRAVVSTSFDKSFPGAPEGDYATVDFRTSFERRLDGGETVSLEHEPDGVWRVIGYSIH